MEIKFNGKPIFFDAGDFKEDARIEMIGKVAAARAEAGFIVEDDVKADRYVKKLLERFPTIEVHHRGPGPVKDTIFVRMGPKPH